MADWSPRPSTDQETAPLLRDPDEEDTAANEESTLMDRINSVAQEPLTPLTKVLLVVALILLLLSSVFIGLFAGVQHKLNLERGKHDDPSSTISVTLTATSTATATETATSTSIATTTASPPTPTGAPEEPVCLTEDCILLAASILSSIDTKQDPCENFYEFANGGWLRAHPLPADKGSFGNFEALAQDNEHVIQRILEDQSSTSTFTTSDDTQILAKLRGFYSSCMNEAYLDDRGHEPLMVVVNNIRQMFRGKQVVIKDGNGDSNGLTAALAYMHSRGLEALFSFEIEGDVGVDPNHLVLWFSQPSLGLPSKEYYDEEDIRSVYQDVVQRLLLAVSDEDEKNAQQSSNASPALVQQNSIWPPWPWPPWGGDDDDGSDGGSGGKKPINKTKRAHKLAQKVLEFETKLARASLDLDILYQDPIATYNPAPISNLTDSLPQIHFKEYFSTFASRNYPDRVIITYPPFVQSLSDILNETSSDVVEAYLVTQAALSLSSYLGMGTEAWQAQRTLVEALSGIKKGAVGDRAEYCVNQVEQALGFAAGRYFVNETFSGESKEKGTKVITDIVKAFQRSLKGIDWMDNKSAKAASDKAQAIRVKVGYPLSPDTTNPTSIANYYAKVTGDKDTFFENVLSASISNEIRGWLQLGKQRDVNAWEMYPSMVNAYFNPPANEIVFPAGILQPPFFKKDWPAYISYGAFGQVAAHELTHAFDSAGRLYNQHGKLEQWWTNQTSQGFQAKQDCIIKQFSGYSIDDGKGGKVYVNGNLTSGENIGDTGLVQAYRAWKAQYDSSYEAGQEFLLPGLPYTREQLFFISFARIWARSMKPAAAVQRIRTDPHSPSKYRVDGTVFNIKEFGKAFSCPSTAKLNPPPEKQCIFWGR
ncbi:Metalloprotease [Lentinula raphanica]|nr:Metalloprotease [Lentinula raphanica]KAJ3977659.1 Metalloprotease [Lentinula raphanica]